MDEKGDDSCTIRNGTASEMRSLWRKKHTTEFFANQLEKGNAVFWTLDCGGQLMGELYAFQELSDKDFADGKTTAYLCAFRIHASLRGEGYGTKLLNYALQAFSEAGFAFATIGVEPSEEANMRLYRRNGFAEVRKSATTDPCDFDAYGKPLATSPFLLLRRSLSIGTG